MLYALWFAPAFAWNVTETPDGRPFHFPSSPIHWRFESAGSPDELDPEAQRAAVESALEAWLVASGTTIAFVEDPDGPPQDVSRIHWAEEWSYDPDYLAVTTTDASTAGEIRSFTMVLNPTQLWTTEPNPFDMDFQNTVTHEIGHGIGLAHSDVAEATMYAETLPGDVAKRDLAPDDIEAMQYLYADQPPEKTPLEQLLGCNGTGTSAPLSTTTLIGLAPWIPGLLRFKVRRAASAVRPV